MKCNRERASRALRLLQKHCASSGAGRVLRLRCMSAVIQGFKEGCACSSLVPRPALIYIQQHPASLCSLSSFAPLLLHSLVLLHSAPPLSTASTSTLVMENSCFPIEVCERIIDCCFELERPIGYHATLRACALTCSAWLPRSLYNLFHTVDLCSRQQCDQYLAVIAEHPERAGWVRVLYIHARDHQYWPLTQLIAPHLHTNCHELSLQVSWKHFPPHYIYKVLSPLLRRCTDITKLHLDLVDLRSFSEMSCIVLSMPWLQTLRIVNIGPEMSRMHWQPRRRQPCIDLTTLEIVSLLLSPL
ncbi:hypothetical protein OH77DRAFT_1298638 [Trametes cingulata]|nr:hypothetical protein OH77DRAFT_1298638 [Trametes cingulata]